MTVKAFEFTLYCISYSFREMIIKFKKENNIRMRPQHAKINEWSWRAFRMLYRGPKVVVELLKRCCIAPIRQPGARKNIVPLLRLSLMMSNERCCRSAHTQLSVLCHVSLSPVSRCRHTLVTLSSRYCHDADDDQGAKLLAPLRQILCKLFIQYSHNESL